MKLHPLSVPYRGLSRGVAIGSTGFFVGAMLGAVGPAERTLLAVPLAIVGFLVGVGYEVARYRRFDYALAETTFDIASGVFSRRERNVPYRRVQNVDISQSLVQRVLGLATLRIETAGGGETEASLQYVGESEARRLQEELSRLKARRTREGGRAEGAETEPAPDAETAPAAEPVFELGGSELVLLSLLSFDPRMLSLVFFGGPVVLPSVGSLVPDDAVQAALFVVGVLGLLATLAVLWLASAAVTFVQYYGFRLTRVGDELRYERGLLQRYRGSIPLEKVQALTIEENVLMRRFGFASLAVETAGYAPGNGSSRGSESAIPLAATERVLSLARDVEPFEEPTFERPPARARRRYAVRYALVVLLLVGIVYAVHTLVLAVPAWYAPLVLLAVAPVAAHLNWIHRGRFVGGDHVVTRNGFWSRTTNVVPYYRVQTVIDRRTVFQRRWRLATVLVDTASSSGLLGRDPMAVDVDAADAERLRERVASELQRAVRRRRVGSGPDGGSGAGSGPGPRTDADR